MTISQCVWTLSCCLWRGLSQTNVLWFWPAHGRLVLDFPLVGENITACSQVLCHCTWQELSVKFLVHATMTHKSFSFAQLSSCDKYTSCNHHGRCSRHFSHMNDHRCHKQTAISSHLCMIFGAKAWKSEFYFTYIPSFHRVTCPALWVRFSEIPPTQGSCSQYWQTASLFLLLSFSARTPCKEAMSLKSRHKWGSGEWLWMTSDDTLISTEIREARLSFSPFNFSFHHHRLRQTAKDQVTEPQHSRFAKPDATRW